MPKTKMDSKIKQEWIDALRSGEYPQTKGRLVRTQQDTDVYPPGYCCLGVLSEILVRHGVLSRLERDFCDPKYTAATGEKTMPEEMTLHPAAIEAIKLDDDCDDDYPSPEVRVYLDSLPLALRMVLRSYTRVSFSITTLAALNDAGAPFSLIADVVEHGIEGI